MAMGRVNSGGEALDEAQATPRIANAMRARLVLSTRLLGATGGGLPEATGGEGEPLAYGGAVLDSFSI